MESPHLAWEFMKKLANGPWAPVIRLIEDPDILGCEPSLNLQEDLADCALVAEETNPAQRKAFDPECSSEDSDDAPRYYALPSDSDDSVVLCEDIEQIKPSAVKPSYHKKVLLNSSDTATGNWQRSASKPCPKSKKPVPPSLGCSSKSKSCTKIKRAQLSSSCLKVSSGIDFGGAKDTHIGDEATRLIEYNGQLLKMKPVKIVLLDLARIYQQFRLEMYQKPSERLEDRSDAIDFCKDDRIGSDPIVCSSDSDESAVIDVGTDGSQLDELKNSGSSNLINLKRPQENLSWGLDSIQELEKRRKLGKTVTDGVNEQPEAAVLTSCSTETFGFRPAPAKSKTLLSKSKLSQSSSVPNNTFGLNAWRAGLVKLELERLQELAKKLQKTHLKPDLQKEVAYKFKYGLNEVARFVTKKSLNSIIAERERLELKESRKKECQVSNARSENKTLPESRLLLREMSPSAKLEQVSQLARLGKEKNCPCSDQPVVDICTPNIVHGFAAGFLGILDRFERLESRCNDIEKRVAKS